MNVPSIDSHFAVVGRDSEARDDPARMTAVVRGFLDAGRLYLRELHAAGGSGREVNEAHSDLIDRLVRRLFAQAEESFFADGGVAEGDLCALAVGGYARREMSIHSDVDLLFLYRGGLTPFVTGVSERVQRWLWDSGLSVGCATRTMAETIALGRGDDTVRTAILEPRFLVGSGVLFHEFARDIRSQLFPKPERFIEELVQAMNQRHQQYGESLYLLQPNLKDGAGGLRDYHASFWAMQATQPSARGLDDFLHLGLLTEDEMAEYAAALDFLWRVRNEIHLTIGRKNDQMSFELQEKIAATLGYDRPGPDDSDLPVERFMRDYYLHARSIQNHSSLVIEQCRSRLRRKPRRARIREVEGGFRISNGQLEIPHFRYLRDEPLRLLEAFAVAQRHDVPLTRKALRLIREHLYLIDDGYRGDPRAVGLFLSVLDAENRVMRTLMAMNEVGLLAAFLPEWEHIVCRWQHVMYHTYTVDVHTIFLVEGLRRLRLGRFEDTLPELTALARVVDDWPVLFLGCLYHDIAKGMGGNHSNLGAELARDGARRLGLSPERVDRVVFLVKDHLLMSHLAQSRDLSDPKLILDFARNVGDRANLRDLYLLTFADIQASSATAWTDWKGQLLRELFERTSELLERGSTDSDTAIELIERRVETRRTAATTELVSLGIPEQTVIAYFEMMPRRYFTAHTPRQIARHAQVVLGYEPEKGIATAVRDMRAFSEFILCTADRRGLHAEVSGTLTAHHLNILGAHVYTTRSGLALEIYRLSTPPGGEEERRFKWRELEASLARVLSGEIDADELLRSRGRPLGSEAAPSHQPASVNISNDESDFYTIVDVTADDRLGLLHDLTGVIAQHGYEIYISKAATVLDQVTDTFYLKDRDRKKLSDGAAVEGLKRDLYDAARRGGEAGGP